VNSFSTNTQQSLFLSRLLVVLTVTTVDEQTTFSLLQNLIPSLLPKIDPLISETIKQTLQNEQSEQTKQSEQAKQTTVKTEKEQTKEINEQNEQHEQIKQTTKEEEKAKTKNKKKKSKHPTQSKPKQTEIEENIKTDINKVEENKKEPQILNTNTLLQQISSDQLKKPEWEMRFNYEILVLELLTNAMEHDFETEKFSAIVKLLIDSCLLFPSAYFGMYK
jgi:hypothetical protein